MIEVERIVEWYKRYRSSLSKYGQASGDKCIQDLETLNEKTGKETSKESGNIKSVPTRLHS